jgi:DNA repair protein RadC
MTEILVFKRSARFFSFSTDGDDFRNKEGSLNYSLDEAIISPEIARDVIEKVFNLSSSPVEKFGIMTLNTKNRITGLHMLAVGGLNQTIIEAREVFQQPC